MFIFLTPAKYEMRYKQNTSMLDVSTTVRMGTTVCPEKRPECFLKYLLQNVGDLDKIRYTVF